MKMRYGLSNNIYDEKKSREIYSNILNEYIALFENLKRELDQL